MSITLFGLKPKDTYQALIKVGNNTNLDGTKKILSDGLGNDLPMEVSTTEVNFTGTLKQGNVAVPTSAQVNAKQDALVSGTNIKTVNGNTLLGSGDLVIGTAVSWGAILGTLSAQTDLQNALNAKVNGNAAIVGATKTKITFDSKGLIVSASDATTADILDSLNKRYVTDAQLVVIANTSGVNSGDNAVNALYSGLAASKQDTLGFVPENVSNKSLSVATDQASNTKYPSVKAVYDWAVGLFIAKNVAITPATKTKVTYDANGLVTAGADLAVGDIPLDVRIQNFIVACSDESTALTTGLAKVTFRVPYAFTLTAVRASLTTAQVSGSIFTVDINENGTSILSTKITIDNTEKTSTTAVTAPVISDTALADDSEITIDIDQIGNSTAKGLKVVLIGYKA